jgi:hypothetical protein
MSISVLANFILLISIESFTMFAQDFRKKAVLLMRHSSGIRQKRPTQKLGTRQNMGSSNYTSYHLAIMRGGPCQNLIAALQDML